MLDTNHMAQPTRPGAAAVTDDAERFIAAIRQTIETQLEHLMGEHDRREGVILLHAEGTSIDLDALARAVHHAVEMGELLMDNPSCQHRRIDNETWKCVECGEQMIAQFGRGRRGAVS